MQPLRWIACMGLAGLVSIAPAARSAPAPADVLSRYALAAPPSEFISGCFAPCVCADPARAALNGTFRLARRGRPDPVTLNSTFDLSDLRWRAVGDGKTTTITGSGVYTHTAGSPPGERLVLDLVFDGAVRKHFDTGTRRAEAAFPEIRMRFSLHGEHCRDTVFVVAARPTGVARPVPPDSVASPGPKPDGEPTVDRELPLRLHLH